MSGCRPSIPTAKSGLAPAYLSRAATTQAMAKLKGWKVIALAAMTCGLVIASCGSSSGVLSAPSASSLARAELKVSECMRSHGVSTFPDPSGGAGGFNLNGSGINPQSPAFQSAQRTCFKLLPGGGPGAHPAAQAMAQARQVAQCMRHHGISGFPDPTLTVPPLSSRAEYSIVDDRNGAVLAVPRTINAGSPAFKQAATACGFD